MREEYARAVPYAEQALTMRRRLYNKARYPGGHPNLAESLDLLGSILLAQGEYARALPVLEQAQAMHLEQLLREADGAAEAQALALVDILPGTGDGVLSVTAHLPNSDATAYRQVWQAKGALTRILERRHLASIATADPRARAKWEELRVIRRQLDQAMARPSANPAARDRELHDLTDRKEQLERELTRLLPQFPWARRAEEPGPDDLAAKLPQDTVLLDLLRYHRSDLGRKPPNHYVAFVVAHGQPVRRVELGASETIHEAVAAWRACLNGSADDRTAAARVGKLLWGPIAEALPKDTRRIYVAPNHATAVIPWGALPGSQEGTVLLERYTFATVPHGRFLLERFLHPPTTGKDAGRALLLGDVAYGGKDGLNGPYSTLKASAEEIAQVRKLAGNRPCDLLTGECASTEALSARLPKARYAHLATHGFFNYPELREEFARREKQWEQWREGGLSGPRGLGARNLLAFSGLVLAGANAGGGKGILTGEALVELPLEGLEVVVLSACESGLGVQTHYEGTMGLQRAFHLAGAQNVVCSLWKVEDEATAALMTLFYRNLWQQKLEPVEALRQAQLYLYYHPQDVKEVARRASSVDFTPKPLPKDTERPQTGAVRGPARQWAAFVFSGVGGTTAK